MAKGRKLAEVQSLRAEVRWLRSQIERQTDLIAKMLAPVDIQQPGAAAPPSYQNPQSPTNWYPEQEFDTMMESPERWPQPNTMTPNGLKGGMVSGPMPTNGPPTSPQGYGPP